jgi:hypothetical protein
MELTQNTESIARLDHASTLSTATSIARSLTTRSDAGEGSDITAELKRTSQVVLGRMT